ncbi:MAG: rRNA pseudouridine synthase [Ruminococcaceae bacterium]|nr:rRNA pseudouridine synthase [Oscillospiraceae bacterium]
MEEIRLQKYISECGIMSRRAAEAEILRGAVTVNGLPAEVGQKIRPGEDEVILNGRKVVPISRNPVGTDAKTYIMLNKPVGYVTTMSDEKERPTVKDLIKDAGVRLYPVGRLDMYSDGLLLCTNDGDLTNRLTHPSHDVAKMYRAVITATLSDEDIAKLGESIEIDGYMTRPVETARESYTTVHGKAATVVIFTLREGRNRQIRRMCAHHGYKLASLTRFRMGEIELGDLPHGKWRHLTEDEIAYLKQI